PRRSHEMSMARSACALERSTPSHHPCPLNLDTSIPARIPRQKRSGGRNPECINPHCACGFPHPFPAGLLRQAGENLPSKIASPPSCSAIHISPHRLASQRHPVFPPLHRHNTRSLSHDPYPYTLPAPAPHFPPPPPHPHPHEHHKIKQKHLMRKRGGITGTRFL